VDAPRTPHRRHDPLLDEWVLVSPGRIDRPWSGAEEPSTTPAAAAYDPDCYLCPGNARAGGAVNPSYGDTFVFTNDFAALRPETVPAVAEEGLLRTEAESGTCRVVCFSPRHDLTLAAMAPGDVRRVVDLWASESVELGRRYRWVQVFENRGEAMGASSPHPHGQIWAGSAVPSLVVREDVNQRRHRDRFGRSLLGEYLAAEDGGPRMVVAGTHWSAIVPFWATWPYESLIAPRRAIARLPDLDDAERDDLASTLRELLGGYDRLFDRPFPYSMGWHQAPFGDADVDHWQLHAHVYPPLLGPTRRKFMVGYELLAEPQRDLTPEDAATALRAAVGRTTGD
jgi:UDPglucose--hexose-1-phosphate uridylyltransferase